MIVLMVSWGDCLSLNMWIVIFVICVMLLTNLAIKKAVSHQSINVSVSADSVERVMRFNLMELDAMGTEF